LAASSLSYDKGPAELLAEAELGDDGAVAFDVVLVEIGELASPLTDHLEQPSSAVMVTSVDAEVLGKVVDALGQKSNLHLGRACVAFVRFVSADDLGFSL
jgi:hypothetical protein